MELPQLDSNKRPPKQSTPTELTLEACRSELTLKAKRTPTYVRSGPVRPSIEVIETPLISTSPSFFCLLSSLLRSASVSALASSYSHSDLDGFCFRTRK